MTAKTPTQLTAEVATSFPDNTSGLITPLIMRIFQNDIIDSFSSGSATGVAVGTTPITGGTTGRVLFDNGGLLGEMALAAGTDPLFLTLGLSVATDNPTVGGSTFSSAEQVFITNGNSRGLDPAFQNIQAIAIDYTFNDGDYNYGFGGNQMKSSAMARHSRLTSYGAAQKFIDTREMLSYGMGDTFFTSDQMHVWGGPEGGDEGIGWLSASVIEQGTSGSRAISNIVSVVRTTFSTTLTQNVTGNKNPQTVTVASTVGANINDWIVVNQSYDTGANNIEATQITAVGAGTITAVFRSSYSTGMTLTPALVLTMSGLFEWGQQRLAVNIDGASYSAGTVIGSVGGNLTGSGTTWANNMVGGDSANPGAISLDKDTYTGSPYGIGNPLRSWYQINADITSPTSLSVHSFSVAADLSYRGFGSFPSTYIVQPAARILRIFTSTNQVICETSTHVWTGQVECVHCPYPDVNGMDFRVAFYTPGGTYRYFLELSNLGARTFGIAVAVGGQYNPTFAGNGDKWAYTIGAQFSSCQSGVVVAGPADSGVRFVGGSGSITKGIDWPSAFISDSATAGLALNFNDSIWFCFRQDAAHPAGLAISTFGPPPAVATAGIDMQIFEGSTTGIRLLAGGAQTANFLTLENSFGVQGYIDSNINVVGNSVRGNATTFANVTARVGTSAEGMLAGVIDSTTNVLGATITGGGGNHVLAYYNGSNWIVAAA